MAKISRKKISGAVELRMLAGMVQCEGVIAAVCRLDPPLSYLSTTAARTVYGWLFDYHEDNRTAPEKEIMSIYRHAVHTGRLEGDAADDVAALLEEISESLEFDEMNEGAVVSQAEEAIKLHVLEDFADKIYGYVSQGDALGAEALLAEFAAPSAAEDAASRGIDPLQDEEAMFRAYAAQATPLFKLPGGLGRKLNRHLIRAGFVAFQAKEKSGKTFLLNYIGLAAQRAGLNVVFFQAGDLSLDQAVRRLGQQVAKRPTNEEDCGSFYVPVADCVHNQDNTCALKWRTNSGGVLDDDTEGNTPLEVFMAAGGEAADYSPCTSCRRRKKHYREFSGAVWYEKKFAEAPMSYDAARTTGKKRMGQVGKKKGLKLICVPAETLSVADMRSYFKIWEREGWFPDVVISDYPDIYAPEPGKAKEGRDKVNSTWVGLRALSQEYNCLVVAATQSNVKAHEDRKQTALHFSEDKRKFAHVTAFAALNTTPEEDACGVARVSLLFAREGAANPHHEVTVLRSLRIGAPVLDSW